MYPFRRVWTQYEWQLQTYGELRRTQRDALNVVAGVLLYVNELFPTRSDIEHLKHEIASGTTDVPPTPGSSDETVLKNWKTRDKQLPQLSFDYRLARAFRVAPVTPQSIAQALLAFDNVVKDIETCRGREVHGTPMLQAWMKNSNEESSCVVCDSRTYCPDYQAKYATTACVEPKPGAPRQNIRYPLGYPLSNACGRLAMLAAPTSPSLPLGAVFYNLR